MGTLALARVQAILTALIFEHSLRVRVKAEASGESSLPGTGNITPVETSDPHRIDQRSTLTEASTVSGEETRRTTALSTSTLVEINGNAESSVASTPKGKEKAVGPSKAEMDPNQPKKKPNLIGKINTLATVDVDKISDAKDFLLVVLLVPLELILSCIFLYTVLGWR